MDKEYQSGDVGRAALRMALSETRVEESILREELAKLEADLKYQEGFLQSVLKKLSNEKFVSKAPANVIDMERKKQADAESKIASLKESIAALKK